MFLFNVSVHISNIFESANHLQPILKVVSNLKTNP